MDSTAAPLQKLIEQFARLPGVGRKMAQRFAFYVFGLRVVMGLVFSTCRRIRQRNFPPLFWRPKAK